MTEKEQKSLRNKKWREEHKEKIKEKQKIWRIEKGKKWKEGHEEEIKEKSKIYRKEHKEKIKEKKREYYQAHKEEIKLRTNTYYHLHKKPPKPRKNLFWINMGGVYEILCNVNNKRYIGRTTHLRVRKSMHFSRLRKKYYKLRDFQKDYDLYGEKNFIFKPLIICEEKDAEKYEQYFVDLYKNKKILYNIAVENVNNCKGVKHAEEIKAKRRKPVSFERREKIREASKLRRKFSHLTEEWKDLYYNKKISMNKIAKMYNTNFHTIKNYVIRYEDKNYEYKKWERKVIV